MLLTGFRDFDLVAEESRITHVLFSTGMHPVCLGNPLEFLLVMSDGLFTWERAKTRAQVSVPVDPAVEPWADDLLAGFRSRPLHPTNVNQAVHRFGRSINLPAGSESSGFPSSAPPPSSPISS